MLKRKYKENPLNIAWDIDDTLWKVTRCSPSCGNNDCKPSSGLEYCETHKPNFQQVPDIDLLQIVRWFYYNGDNCFVWSAGGVAYAKDMVRKLGLEGMVTVVIKKHDAEDDKVPLDKFPPKMDIAFDDSEVDLAKVDIKVTRVWND